MGHPEPKPEPKAASEDENVDDRSSERDPKGHDAAGAVARLRALHDALSAEQNSETPEADAGSKDGQGAHADGAPKAQAHGAPPAAEPQPEEAADAEPSHSLDPEQLRHAMRVTEAMIFASSEPVAEARLASHLPEGTEVAAVLAALQESYAGRGVSLVRVAGKWSFRTADDLSYLLEKHAAEERRLSKAALETLSIIAYHQPVTRAEIEAIRGVATSKGTLDVLMETGWVRPRGRRRAPGKPITYGTTDEFLAHFGLDTVKDLPGLAELRGAGLLGDNLPPDFAVPEPSDVAALMPDELPLEDQDEDAQSELSLEDGEDEPAETQAETDSSDVAASDPADEESDRGA